MTVKISFDDEILKPAVIHWRKRAERILDDVVEEAREAGEAKLRQQLGTLTAQLQAMIMHRVDMIKTEHGIEARVVLYVKDLDKALASGEVTA